MIKPSDIIQAYQHDPILRKAHILAWRVLLGIDTVRELALYEIVDQAEWQDIVNLILGDNNEIRQIRQIRQTRQSNESNRIGTRFGRQTAG